MRARSTSPEWGVARLKPSRSAMFARLKPSRSVLSARLRDVRSAEAFPFQRPSEREAFRRAAKIRTGAPHDSCDAANVHRRAGCRPRYRGLYTDTQLSESQEG